MDLGDTELVDDEVGVWVDGYKSNDRKEVRANGMKWRKQAISPSEAMSIQFEAEGE